VRYLRFTVVSRAGFDLLNESDPAKLTDIKRAARHFYLAKNCYGGLVRHSNYAVRVDAPPGFNPEHIPSLIEEKHHRLARVQLECLPYEEVLMFDLADKIETRYKAVQQQVDRLPQSILAKAFRCDLVPAEAELAEREGRSYESAELLLQRIRSSAARLPDHTTRGRGRLNRSK
jgi:hypothetical protein